MAKQLVLYMTPEDEAEFLDYVRSLGNLLILPGTSPNSNFTALASLPEASPDESTRRFWLLYLGAGMPLVTEPVNADSYVVDGFQSPVIEFWRSWTVSHVLFPGGLEAELNYFDDDKQDLARKPVEFRRWFEAIDNWIRKNFVRLGIYVFAGTGAVEFRERGGILQGR